MNNNKIYVVGKTKIEKLMNEPPIIEFKFLTSDESLMLESVFNGFIHGLHAEEPYRPVVVIYENSSDGKIQYVNDFK